MHGAHIAVERYTEGRWLVENYEIDAAVNLRDALDRALSELKLSQLTAAADQIKILVQ